MSKKHISGILAQYIGQKDEAIADLSVYLDNPVGVGEHSNIGNEIRAKIKEIDSLDSLIETINRYFASNTGQDTAPESDE